MATDWGDLLQERQQQNSGGMHEGPAGLQLSHTAIRNDVLSDTASLQQLEKTVDVPQRVPTTHLIDWLAELDPAGFLKCYLPILLTMGHRTARDVVHKCLACAFASLSAFHVARAGIAGMSKNVQERHRNLQSSSLRTCNLHRTSSGCGVCS